MRWPPVLALAALGLAALAACGDDDPTADDRASQVREAATEAGLTEEVADVLALAARGATATYQLAYPGDEGMEVVVSQDPPYRRVDVLQAGLVVRSQVVRDDVAYVCEVPEGGRAGEDLECERTQGAVPATGTFTDEALDDFVTALAAGRDAHDLSVEEREIAGVTATCLVATPAPGRTEEAQAETICLAPDGAQLLVDSEGQRVEATRYDDAVPSGTFEVRRK